VCIALTALLTAQLGGGRRAQTIAAAAIAGCPIFVGGSLFFGPTVLDQLVWVAVFVLVARALRLGGTRAWLWVGLAAGIGLENKDTVAVLLAGLAVGLALVRREVLRSRGPWLAGLLAVLIALPNVLWDAAHHWPNRVMAEQLSRQQGGTLGALAKLPALPLYLGGMLLIGASTAGCCWSPWSRSPSSRSPAASSTTRRRPWPACSRPVRSGWRRPTPRAAGGVGRSCSPPPH
jgi:hypothetical protein